MATVLVTGEEVYQSVYLSVDRWALLLGDQWDRQRAVQLVLRWAVRTVDLRGSLMVGS